MSFTSCGSPAASHCKAAFAVYTPVRVYALFLYMRPVYFLIFMDSWIVSPFFHEQLCRFKYIKNYVSSICFFIFRIKISTLLLSDFSIKHSCSCPSFIGFSIKSLDILEYRDYNFPIISIFELETFYSCSYAEPQRKRVLRPASLLTFVFWIPAYMTETGKSFSAPQTHPLEQGAAKCQDQNFKHLQSKCFIHFSAWKPNAAA